MCVLWLVPGFSFALPLPVELGLLHNHSSAASISSGQHPSNGTHTVGVSFYMEWNFYITRWESTNTMQVQLEKTILLLASWARKIRKDLGTILTSSIRPGHGCTLLPTQGAIIIGEPKQAKSCWYARVWRWHGFAERSGSSLTNLQVQAVSQSLELPVHVLDDLFWASQPSPRCKGWPSVD